MDEGHNNKSYKDLHKPASDFTTRKAYLENELKIMSPKRWSLNLPKRDFNFEIEDLVPAISGTIGIIVKATAIVAAFAAGFGLSPEFVVENVRFELLLASLLFIIPISGFINPKSNLPGAHGPMIPLIGLIVIAGGHPLALGILIGAFGLMLGLFKGGSKLIDLTGIGVRGGLLIYLGLVGLIDQITALGGWAAGIGNESIFLVVILLTIIIYAYLARIGKRWLAIPLCSLIALIVALLMGGPFRFTTTPGIPNLNPLYWWGTDTGWMLGLPNAGHFIAALPFAILSIAMWPPDFLGHRIFQEMNYPKGADKVLMDVDDTMINCSVRQVVGSLLGGGNVTSSGGPYIIPAGIAKRPIPGGAIIMGIFLIVTILIGYPMDIAIWPPVLKVALIVGVFLPLLEAGMQMIREPKQSEGAAICMSASALVNPVFGWAFAMLLDNSGVLGDITRSRSLPVMDRIVIPLITTIICVVAMAAVGLIPGIPKLI
ncbi:MAG: DUF3360 family protein [Methanobacteriaceae archaeon]|jgi:hypothetical protein